MFIQQLLKGDAKIKLLKQGIDKIFLFTYKLGESLLELRDAFLLKLLFIISVVLLFVLSNVQGSIFLKLICLSIVILVLAIGCSKKSLLSITGFLGVGCIYWFLFSCIIKSFIETNDLVMDIIILNIIYGLTWCFYSLLANNRVASTVNQIVSAVFAVIVLLKDTIILLIPDTVMDKMYVYDYTTDRLVEAVFNFICTPILITNIIAMTLCMLKGYWIEKYNDNRDIGQDNFDVKKEIEALKEQNRQLVEKVDELTQQIK